MQTSVDELVQQSTDAGVIINARKTMGMLIGGGELCRFYSKGSWVPTEQ